MPTLQEICPHPELRRRAQTLGLAGPKGTDELRAVYLPGRDEIKSPIPMRYRIGGARHWINKDAKFTGGIRLHHAKAAEAWEAGENVVLTTGTGSGKSLVYMLEAMHLVSSDPNARVIAVYPTQALNADQQNKWRTAAAACGLQLDAVGIIDGTVPTFERLDVLKKARVLVTTPDSLDAWLMANLDEAACRDFLKNRRLTIIDEAHLYVGALGSNVMYLMRRIETVQRWLNPNFKPERHSRFIAASATMADAPSFLRMLTGRDFVEIGEEFNGAGIHPKLVVASSSRNTLEAMAGTILEAYPDKQFLVFRDNRRDVEDFAAQFDDDEVTPYKSGMAKKFRDAAHSRMQSGSGRGIVATSALEVGIDMTFDFVLNDGLPHNMGRALQRMGRAGRHGPGLFVFANSLWALREYGYDLSRYLNAPITPITLYPNNEYIQFAHALRLKRERKQIKEKLKSADVSSLKGVKWPAGFDRAWQMTHQKALDLPIDIRSMLPTRGVTPHRFHGIRDVAGMGWRIGEWNKTTKWYDDRGSTNTMNAFFEYPPGRIVRHQGRRWRVQRWTQDRFGNMVIDIRPLFQSELNNSTGFKHIKYAQADGRGAALLGTHVLYDPKTVKSDSIDGMFVAETKIRLQIGLSGFIENYTTKEGDIRTKSVWYHEDEELAHMKAEEVGEVHDYGPRRRMVINTTGVVIHLPNRQFGKDKRIAIAEAVIEEYCATYNYERSDIGYQETMSRFVAPTGEMLDSGNLVIYDRTAGSLRLTQQLASNLPRMVKRAIARLEAERSKITDAHKEVIGPFQPVRKSETQETLEWFAKHLEKTQRFKKKEYLDTVQIVSDNEKAQTALPDGYVRVIPPGARADWLRGGIAQRLKVIEPRVVEGALYYEVFAVDRYAFFSKARQRRFEKQDITGYASEERPMWQQNATLEAVRLIPASELVLGGGRYVGYNPDTKHYIDLKNGDVTEDISTVVEERIRDMRLKQTLLRENGNTQPPASTPSPKPKVA